MAPPLLAVELLLLLALAFSEESASEARIAAAIASSSVIFGCRWGAESTSPCWPPGPPCCWMLLLPCGCCAPCCRLRGGEPQKFAWTAGIVSIERALLLIKSGAQAEIEPQLPALIYRLLPLLELIDVKHECDLPLERLRALAAEADTSLLGK